MRKYQEIRHLVRVGDVFAYSGKSDLSSLIKFRTGSPYSHVSVCIGFHKLLLGQPASLLMCESTIQVDKKDDISGEILKGVQIHKISSRFAMETGTVWWVPLKKYLTELQEFRMMEWIFKKHSSRTPYDKIQAIGSAIDWWDGIGFENKPDFEKLFCSELVARAYQVAGVIWYDCNPSEMTPGDIIDLPVLNDPVEL